MSTRRRSLPARLVAAGRVAAAATVVITLVYGGCVVALNMLVAGRLVGQVDARLAERLADTLPGLARRPPARSGHRDDDDDSGPPVLLWRVSRGAAVPLTASAPPLSARLAPRPGSALSARVGTDTFRLMAMRRGGVLLVAGQSLTAQDHIQATLAEGELLAAPVLVLAIFAGSLIIGLRALSPVEQSRQRQLEFTADASHELRTPLSVIRAETGIALSSPRRPAEYRDALERIRGESERLTAIVEDLLWLARFDSRPPPPGDEPLDLSTIAAGCADRFATVAAARSVTIEVGAAGSTPAWITAPPEWIDRLAGVLLDNACRHAGPGGTVRISAAARGGSVSLAVEDSGPGVPPGERPRLFDRFHRAGQQGGGAGLGLAIADSIAGSTGGHWRIGTSDLGGALFEVSWKRAAGRPRGLPAGPGGRDRPAQRPGPAMQSQDHAAPPWRNADCER
ncbi:MAG: sensor histidine kinase [Streptosporangiaceae bacterium]